MNKLLTTPTGTRVYMRGFLLSILTLACASVPTVGQIVNPDGTGISVQSQALVVSARLGKAFRHTGSLHIESLRNQPLSFEANRGQTSSNVKYLARGKGYTLFLTASGVILALQGAARSQWWAEHPDPATAPQELKTPFRLLAPSRPWDGDTGTAVKPLAPPKALRTRRVQPAARQQTRVVLPNFAFVRMELAGANPSPRVDGREALPGRSNYIIGGDPAKWRTNVPHYARVEYQSIYPGIDLVFYGNGGDVECDFRIAPGADPKQIKLDFSGSADIESLGIDEEGNLLIAIHSGQLSLRRPVVYQVNGQRAAVSDRTLTGEGKGPLEAHYVLTGPRQVSFEVPSYDSSKTLVIDPVLGYSTYLGGEDGSDSAFALAVDSSGNAYVTGTTTSLDFPTLNGLPNDWKETANAFVSKFSASGALVYSTYLGGGGGEEAYGIRVDTTGAAYIAGRTSSADLGVSAPGLRTPGPNRDIFVAKLSPSGSSLLYAALLGGSLGSNVTGLALDSGRNAYVTGYTDSADFPTTPGAYKTSPANPNATDSFVFKLNSSGTALVYSTYLGGSLADYAQGIGVDSSGNAYVAGLTASTDFPITSGATQSTNAGGFDVFVSKLNASGSNLVYSTYLGGSAHDGVPGASPALAIAADSSGNAYVTGVTLSDDFPTSPNALQPSLTPCPPGMIGTCTDAFVTKLNTSGSLVYSTYLGGHGDENGYAVAADQTGTVTVTGSTTSIDFPVTSSAFQSTCHLSTYGDCAGDVFVARLNADGSNLIYASYLGGSSFEAGRGVAVGQSGSAYVTGYTSSVDFPTVNAFQPYTSGGFVQEAFVAKIVPGPAAAVSPPSLSFADQQVGTTSAPQTVTLSNTGDGPLSITSIAVSADFKQTNTCGSSVLAGMNCAISVSFQPTQTGTRSGTLTISDNAPGSPHTVSLSGNGLPGPDFSISVSPTSAAVNAGQSASYELAITPTNGFNSAVSFSCAAIPSRSTCSFSPASVTPDGTNAAKSTMTVTTTARSVAAPPIGPSPFTADLDGLLRWTLWILASMIVLALVSGSRRRGRWVLAGISCFLLVWVSCGGGGSPRQPPPTGTPAGTYTLTISATSVSLVRTASVTLKVS